MKSSNIISYGEQIFHLYDDGLYGISEVCPSVTFQVTEACNLRCTYCYQINKTHHKMDKQTAYKFVDALLNNEYKEYIDINKSKGIVFEFIGGEPFLEIDLIEDVSHYIENKLIELNPQLAMNHKFSFSTNGTLHFDPKVQKYLKEFKDRISLSISIDGDKTLHDSCRIFPDGSGSYDLAIAAEKDYIETFGATTGSKLTIAPENLHYLDTAMKSMMDFGYTDIHANCCFEEGWTIDHAKIFYQKLKNIADMVLSKDLDYLENLSISLFRESNFQPLTEEDNNNWCGGTGGMLSVDWRGDLYPCLRYMPSSLGNDQEPYKIGNINTGILSNKQEKDRVKCFECITRRSQSTDECFYCPVATGCGWCFPAGTKINTPKGLVNIEDLVVGDEVLDGFGNIQKVENNFSRKSNDIVSINAAGIEDQYLTYDHPIYTKQVIKRNNNIPTYGKPTWIKAGELKKSDKIALFVPKLGNKEINLDVAYLLGRYIGDGSKTSSNRTKTPYKYVISCAFDEKEELEKHFKNSGIGYSIGLHRTTYDFNIQTTSNLEFTKLIDDCGRYAIDKHVPSEVYKWDYESVKAFLEGYFDADGYLEKSKVQRYTSVSKNLVYQIAELIRAVYHKNVSITKRTPNPVGSIEGRQVNQNISWEGRFNLDIPQRKYYEYDEDNNIMWVNVSKSKLIEISELEVYNLTVSNTHTFVANGVIVHNCSAYNYQKFGTPNKRATFICYMHKATALANVYYWNKYYRRLEEKEAQETGYITLPIKRFALWLPDEECLKIIDQEELDMLHELERL